MPHITLDCRAICYTTDQQVSVQAWRAFIDARFPNRNGILVAFDCFFDPGAPFSVIPFALWHDLNLQWTPLGNTVTIPSATTSTALTWQGIACDLGSITIDLFDNNIGIGGLEVVAKFPRQRPPHKFERAAILGMNFLADNELQLMLDGTGGAIIGSLNVPGP